MQPSTSDYEAGFLEKDGVQYQQLVAWFLLQRAMLKNEKLKKDGQVFEFRMAFEMKAAGKFDDVPLFLEDGGYLIQLKHTVSRKEDQEKKLTEGMLLSKVEKNPFSLTKYLETYLEMKWKYGKIKHVILFTNMIFVEADSNTEVQLDEIFKFSTGKHIKLTNKAFIDEFKTKFNKHDADVDEFFSKLVLSVEQPNVEELKLDMINESRLWMRTWIRPDDLARQEKSFFKQPLHTIDTEFNEYEKTVKHVEVDGKPQIRREFLEREKGEKILNKIKAKLSVQIQNNSRRSCSGLVDTGYYYINRHIKSEKIDSLEDTEFIEQLYTTFSSQNCFVLTAQPGMGKSTLWQYWAFEAQKLHTESAVFLLYLNNLPHNMPTIEKLEDIITSKIFDSDLSKSNVEMIVKENKIQIVLFFDAFDEIKENSQDKKENSQDKKENSQDKKEKNYEKILKLLTILLKKSNVKIIISGRKHVKETLEKHLNVTALELQEFNHDEQMCFLQKFWKQSADSEKCRTFSQAILDKFHRDISRKDYEFTGIPLMIKMLAEVYAGPFEKYLNSDCELKEIVPDEKLTIISLYDQFAKKCIHITINKKFNVDNNRELDPFFKPLVEKLNFDYQVLAVERFDFNEILKDKKHYATLHSIEDNIKDLQSLIVELVQNEPTFTHLSFGEYFAAKHLFNLVCKTKSYFLYDEAILKTLQIEENIQNLFLAMVDAQIPCDSKLKKNNLNWLKNKIIIFMSCKRDYVEIVKYCYNENRYKTIRDEENKSLLQISIENCAKKTEKFLMEKRAYQHLVHVAVECNRLDLINSDENSTDDDNSQKCLKLFKYLTDNKTSFKLRNETGDTLLHAAVKNCDLKFIEEIFKLKDSNEFHLSECIFSENNERETPLHVAAQKGKIDILIFLFKQFLKKYQIAHLDGNPTLLDICRHYKTEGMMNIAIKKALERNEIDDKSIIEACKLIGMDVHSKVNLEFTALHHAAEKNCKQLAEFLYQNGANLYSQSFFDGTPLHVAVKNNSFEVVEFLVPLMSDIGDLTDRHGNTALHLAAELEDPKCLNLLLEIFSKLKLSLDTKNHFGRSALNCAIYYKIKENVHILIKAGAKPIVNTLEFNLITYLKAVFYLTQTTFNSECKKSKQLLEQFGFDIRMEESKYALHEAAESGWVEMVKFLIENQFEVNYRNWKGQTPLMLASTKEMYDLLVFEGATENLKDKSGNTGLHIAVNKNWIEIVQYLSEKDPSLVNCQNKSGDTPLHLAAKKGHEEMVKILINNKADIDAKNNDGETPAFIALYGNRANVVRFLLEHSAETVAAVWQGLQIMMENDLRFFNMELDMVEVLLAAGLNVKKVYKNGLTLLHAAAQESELDVVQRLVRAGADVDALDDWKETPLHYSMCNRNDVSGFLIEHSADINCKSKDGKTPLHRSIENRRIEATQILLARNACIYLKDNFGNTPLHLAILNQVDDVALLLIDLKANVNEQNNDGTTPLHLAVLNGNLRIVKKLVKNGADLSLKYRESNTPLHLACLNNNSEVALLLIDLKADVNEQNSDGATPLHLAVSKNKFKIVNKLVENGADLSLLNKDHKTALDLAADDESSSSFSEYFAQKTRDSEEGVEEDDDEEEEEDDDNDDAMMMIIKEMKKMKKKKKMMKMMKTVNKKKNK